MLVENFIHICISVTQCGRIDASCEENMSDRMTEQTGHYSRRPVKRKYLLNHGKCEEETKPGLCKLKASTSFCRLETCEVKQT